MKYKPSWVWAHSEDDLAVLRTNDCYARVFYDGANYIYEVMTKANYSEYCLGHAYSCKAEGTVPTHDEARERCEHIVLA